MFLNLPPKLHIVPCLLLVLELFGCDLFIELGFPHNHPTPLHADNTNTTQIATNPVFHELFEHIKVDCHSIQEAFDHWVISLSYTSIALQVVDVFIKAMTR